MSAIDNARAALAHMERIGSQGWCICMSSSIPDEVETGLRELIAEHERLIAEGSCWDEAPSIIVPKGECAPMTARCELRSGHAGAHRSGRTEWMRRGPVQTDGSSR